MEAIKSLRAAVTFSRAGSLGEMSRSAMLRWGWRPGGEDVVDSDSGSGTAGGGSCLAVDGAGGAVFLGCGANGFAFSGSDGAGGFDSPFRSLGLGFASVAVLVSACGAAPCGSRFEGGSF